MSVSVVLHLIHRCLVLVFAHCMEAPVLEHPRVQEVLVDGGDLVFQHPVEVLEYLGIAFHVVPLKLAYPEF